MSIKYQDLLDVDNHTADIIVIPVNAVGVMGKGLARQFQQTYPVQAAQYRDACLNPSSTINTFGYMLSTLTSPRGREVKVLFFVTKRHWRMPSTLLQLKSVFRALRIREQDTFDGLLIGTPPLGCGLGMLDAEQIIPYIRKHFIQLGAYCQVFDVPEASALVV